MRCSVKSILALPLVAFACSSEASGTSAVEGQLALSTYRDPPRLVSALDETGARSNEAVASDGSFRFELEPGHVYKLVVVTSAGEEPVVFPRSGRRLDTTFRVDTAGAVVDLGRVQHYDRAPSRFGSGRVSPTTLISTQTRGDDLHHCDDDRLPFALGPAHCVDDDPRTTCRDGSRPECTRGKHGGRCDDDGPEDDADPSKPMSIPQRNAPNVVSGCHDDHDRTR